MFENATLSCINFSTRSCIDNGRAGCCLRSGLCGGKSVVILEYAPCNQGRKTSINGKKKPGHGWNPGSHLTSFLEHITLLDLDLTN